MKPATLVVCLSCGVLGLAIALVWSLSEPAHEAPLQTSESRSDDLKPGATAGEGSREEHRLLREIRDTQIKQLAILKSIAGTLASTGSDRGHSDRGRAVDAADTWDEVVRSSEQRFVADEVVHMRARLEAKIKQVSAAASAGVAADPQVALDKKRATRMEEAIQRLASVRSVSALVEFKSEFGPILPQ